MSDKITMHGSGESYSGVVLVKQPNKSGRPQAGVVEGRALAKENTPEPTPCRTPCRSCGSHGLARVREAASVRFDAKRPYPRQEPCALVAPASTGLCGGQRATAVPTATAGPPRPAPCIEETDSSRVLPHFQRLADSEPKS